MRNSELLEYILSNPKDLFKVIDIADSVGVSRQNINSHIQRGNLPYFKFGRIRMIRGDHFKQFLESGHLTRKPVLIKEILSSYKLPAQKDE